MPVKQRMTAEEYPAPPESPEVRRAELVDGELIVHGPYARDDTLASPLLDGFEVALGALLPPVE